MNPLQEIISFLKMALECSVLIDPLHPGLTFQELSEIGERAGYLDGEINDALARVATGTSRSRLILPSPRKHCHGSSYIRRSQTTGILMPSISSSRSSTS
jgi:hypothetical protein